MLSQVVYETNADMIASHEAMVKNDWLVRADMTAKGLLWFRFEDNRTVFLLSPFGKLQVKWNDVSEKRTLFKLVRRLLVAGANEKLWIRPLKQQTWIEYPVPESFKLYWCDTTSEFVLKNSTNGTGALTSEKKVSTDDRLTVGGSGVFGESRGAASDGSMVVEVVAALEMLRWEFRFLREPTLNEVAVKSGCIKMDDLERGLHHGGWKDHSLDEAKEIAVESLILASWIRVRESGDLDPRLVRRAKDAIYKASLEALGIAQIILKKSPGLVPQINGTELIWSEKAKMEWLRIFGCELPSQMT